DIPSAHGAVGLTITTPPPLSHGPRPLVGAKRMGDANRASAWRMFASAVAIWSVLTPAPNVNVKAVCGDGVTTKLSAPVPDSNVAPPGASRTPDTLNRLVAASPAADTSMV